MGCTATMTIPAKTYQFTEGLIVFLLIYALLGVAEFSIVTWNEVLSDVVVLGFVVLAQLCMTRYFANPVEDDQQKAIVVLCAIGYALLLVQTARIWNEKLSYGVATGFVLFVTKLAEGYFKAAPPKDAFIVEPPKVPVTEPPKAL